MNKTRKSRGGNWKQKALNYATRKATNFSQSNYGRKLQNKLMKAKNKFQGMYNQYQMEARLNNEFNQRNNVAGMRPGAASRNLLAVANAQTRRRQMNNRRNGFSGRNAYNLGSMLTSFF